MGRCSQGLSWSGYATGSHYIHFYMGKLYKAGLGAGQY